MMELARRVGIEVPDTRLVHRDLVESVPARFWPPGEFYAYAIRRFDRTANRERVHMEDLAQVRGFYPEDKYRGTFETVANLIYRRHDNRSALEFVRRLAFNVLIRNADAHLKNWSLLYRDRRVPELSPAYDLVSTTIYSGVDATLGLRFGGSRRFENVTLDTFSALQRKLGVVDVSFTEAVERIVEDALAAWPEVEQSLHDTALGEPIAAVLRASAAALRRHH
jgi:serine/threonine-protein kinase HipA